MAGAEQVSVESVRQQVEAGTAQMGELTGKLGAVSEQIPESLGTLGLASSLEEIIAELEGRASIAGTPDEASKLPFGLVDKRLEEVHQILDVTVRGSSVDPLYAPALLHMEEKNKESAVNAAAFGGTVTEVSLTLRGVVTALREEAPKHVATIQEKTNGAIVGGKTAAAKATEFVKSI